MKTQVLYKFSGIAFGVFLLAGCVSPEDIAPAYKVTLSASDASLAHASLRLPKTDEPARQLMSRAASVQASSQVKNVKCGGKLLAMNEGVSWNLPARCKTVSWDIELVAHAATEVRPSEQKTLFMAPDWWLFSGPTSLLRLDNAPDEAANITFVLPDKSEQKFALPTLDEPPAFYALGNPPRRTFQGENEHLVYIGEDMQTVLGMVDIEAHLGAIRYFRRVIGPKHSRKSKALQVVWFGARRENRKISGAAGHDTLLVNYIIAEDQPEPGETVLTLVLVLHEQFHQIATASHPQWVGESLANYYALKASATIYAGNDGFEAVRRKFIDANRPVDIGLLDIQKQIDQDNDFENYQLFYTQGASFWADIDAALQRKSGGEKSLDDFVPLIMESDFQASVTLPQPLSSALADILGDDLEKISRHYLAGPP